MEAGSVISGDDLSRPVARNLAVVFSGRAVALVLQFLAFAVAAAYLEPALLGIYTFAIALTALFRLLPAFSFDPIVTRELAQQPAQEPELVPNAAYLRLALSVVAYAALAATLVLGGYDNVRTEAGLIAGLALPMIALDTFRNSLGVRLRLGWTSIADVLEATFTLGGAIVIAATGAGVFAFLWLYVAAKALNGVVLLGAVARMADFDWKPKVGNWRGLLVAAAPLALATMLIALYFRIDMVVLARLKPAADVGQYGAAYRFLDALLLVPALVMSVLQPVIARSAVGDRSRLQRRYWRATQLMAVAGIGIAVLGVMTGPRALPALPGFEDYDGAGRALAVLSVAAALSFIGAVVQTTLIATHRQRQLLYVAGAALLVNIALNAALIPPYSYMGAAWATVITEVAVLVFSLWAAYPLHLGLPVRGLGRALAAGAILAAVLAATHALPPLVQVAVGVLAYGVAVLVTGAVSRSELGLFVRRA
ncbi:MAG TPA: flippase [Gaiellaceae bacterium]|nr:flippase [Gaiellaceae bacterium]